MYKPYHQTRAATAPPGRQGKRNAYTFFATENTKTKDNYTKVDIPCRYMIVFVRKDKPTQPNPTRKRKRTYGGGSVSRRPKSEQKQRAGAQRRKNEPVLHSTAPTRQRPRQSPQFTPMGAEKTGKIVAKLVLMPAGVLNTSPTSVRCLKNKGYTNNLWFREKRQ